nr:MAG TPA: hypothetical protein [Caudoviricetes sp.]
MAVHCLICMYYNRYLLKLQQTMLLGKNLKKLLIH